MVSVFMLAYNQKGFIAQAIEGVLMQETDFPVELVIGEDCSTDGTKEVCQKYAAAHPDKIKLFLNEKNIGLGANYVKTYAECKGKYIAICDGDDYWIDPLKLQKQFDFLESHADFKIVFTNNKNIYPSGKTDIRNAEQVPDISTFNNLIKGNYIASVTVVFRNQPLSLCMRNLINGLPYGDWPTYLYILRNDGKIRFLNDVTAVYRKDFGTSTALRKKRSKIGEINLSILRDMLNDSEFSYRKDLIKKSMVNYRIDLMSSYNKEHKFYRSLSMLSDLIFQGRWDAPKFYFYSLKRTFYK